MPPQRTMRSVCRDGWFGRKQGCTHRRKSGLVRMHCTKVAIKSQGCNETENLLACRRTQKPSNKDCWKRPTSGCPDLYSQPMAKRLVRSSGCGRVHSPCKTDFSRLGRCPAALGSSSCRCVTGHSVFQRLLSLFSSNSSGETKAPLSMSSSP